MEFEGGNRTGPVGRAFDQQQIETIQQVTVQSSIGFISLFSFVFFLLLVGFVFEMRDRKILKKLQESIHETQKVSDVKISRAQSEESIKSEANSTA